MTTSVAKGTGKGELSPRDIALRSLTGDPVFQDRFQAKIKRGTDCWRWLGPINPRGYGMFSYKGISFAAHRVGVVLDGREIPAGMVVDHTCRNRACVNPVHLRVVTARENALENSVGHAAQNSAKTHCPKGHEFTPDNLVQWALRQGYRHCRICTLESQRRRWKPRLRKKRVQQNG